MFLQESASITKTLSRGVVAVGLFSLKSADESTKMEELFKTRTIPVAGVNHFCIADEGNVGNKDKRSEDKPTNLSFEKCQSSMAEAIIHQIV